jgi:hypothetical protein
LAPRNSERQIFAFLIVSDKGRARDFFFNDLDCHLKQEQGDQISQIFAQLTTVNFGLFCIY